MPNSTTITLSLLSTYLKPVSVDRTIIDGEYLGMPLALPFFTEFVLPTYALDDAPEFDAILVPGGRGTRNLNRTQPHIDFLTRHVLNPNLDYVMSVCTGASLLARTGQFAGRNATTNKMAFSWVQTVEHADEINWIAKARWVVDGNLWTSSGVSAGTDITLGWIEHVWGFNTSEKVRVSIALSKNRGTREGK